MGIGLKFLWLNSEGPEEVPIHLPEEPVLQTTNLIRLFDFYLALMFAIGLWRRRKIYIDSIRLGLSTIGKRKRLLDRLNTHKKVLLNRDVVLPFLLVASLTVLQWVCSRMVWPHALLTVHEVFTSWRWIVVVLLFIPMVCVDVYFLIRVAQIDHGETEKYLDYAESWLGRKGVVVSVLTLGFLRPKKIVDNEMIKGLEALGKSARWALWWTSVQSTLRVSFGLAIWFMWAFGPRS